MQSFRNNGACPSPERDTASVLQDHLDGWDPPSVLPKALTAVKSFWQHIMPSSVTEGKVHPSRRFLGVSSLLMTFISSVPLKRNGAPLERNCRSVYPDYAQEDLRNAVVYISTVLNNPEAAERLVNRTEDAILERSESLPGAFQKYSSKHDRKHPYYKIQVEKYGVYYVVYDTEDGPVMEVRRFLHDLQNKTNCL